MPFVVTPEDQRAEELAPGVDARWILPPGRVSDDRRSDDRLRVALVTIAPGTAWTFDTNNDELAWLQVVHGALRAEEEGLTPDHVIMLARGATFVAEAVESTTVLVCRAPFAAQYDPTLTRTIRRVDWTTEPVLQSEHDSRQRIYLASPGLWGTDAVKGEMIIYPAGASGAAHHHEGAEHFQYILSGSGTAYLGDEVVTLNPGDFLYNFENEVHSFANHTDSDMVFVEFFVPGESRTVWVPGVNVCAWNPTATDIKGREPARTLKAHIHGEGDV